MQNLYRALFPTTQQHVLLGRNLRPFSNWHLLQLQFAESPLVGYPGDITAADLAVGAAVCVTTYPQRFAAVRWWELLPYRRALRRMAVIDWIETVHARRLVRVKDEFALAAEVAKWRAYINEFCARPRFFTTRSSGKARMCKVPAPLAMWSALKLRGFPKAAAWDEPVGESAWEKAGLAEAEGAELGDVVTESAIAAMKASGWYDRLAPEDRP